MDARARIPVTLPRDSPTQPFWQDPPDPAISDLRSTAALPATADVVIIGSGITGASIAWHLLEEERQKDSGGVFSADAACPLLMFEARQACSGATGRNGGHTKAASYRAFLDHAAAHGTAAAVQIARLELEGIRAVHAMAEGEVGTGPGNGTKGAISCDSHPCDTLDVVYDPAQWAQAQRAVAAMRAAMPADDPAAEYTLYSREEALAAGFPCSDDEETGGPICGVVRYAAGSISAYRFTAGVLKQCLERGLNLQTNTPALSLERISDGGGADNSSSSSDGFRWTVQTPRGAVAARHVVLATNAYTAFLVPALQGVVVPLRGQVAMLRPGANLPGSSAAAGGRTDTGGGGTNADSGTNTGSRRPDDCLETTYSFIYDQGYEYMIARPPGSACAGDLVLGGGLKFADTAQLQLQLQRGGAGGGGVPGLCEYGTTDDTSLNPAVSAYLRDAAVRYFGRDRHWGADHPAGRVRTEWTGIMGYTPDGHPLVGPMPVASAGPGGGEDKGTEEEKKDKEEEKGLWLCCAFQGHGMVYSWPCGRAVAEMLRGRGHTAELRRWFPDCFRTSRARLTQRFVGRLHTTAPPAAETT